MSYCYEGQGYAYGEEWEKVIEGDSWTNIGAHVEQIIDRDSRILDVIVDMRITSQKGILLILCLLISMLFPKTSL